MVLRDSKILKLDLKIARLESINNNESNAVYCVDNRTTYSVCYTNRNQFFVKNCFFGWSKLSKDDMKDLPKIKLIIHGKKLFYMTVEVRHENLKPNLIIPPSYYQKNKMNTMDVYG